MGEEKRARLKQWLESGEVRLQPLSLPQRELWETTPVPVGDPANHICSMIYVRGRLPQSEAIPALRRVVERQEALRLSVLPGRSGALQMVRRTAEPNVVFRQLTHEECSPEKIEAIAEEIYREPFDLVQGPLYRAVVLQKSEGEHILVFAIHHAVGDGWTLGVFVQDLGIAYAQALLGLGDEALPPVPLSYTAWGAAEQARWTPERLERHLAFWRETLEGAPRPWAAPPLAAPWGLERRSVYLDPELCAGVRALGRQSGATLFSTLLAIFQVALWRWRGVEDLVLGAPVAGRHDPESRETMGSFSSVVPIRSRLSTGSTYMEIIRSAHQQAMDSFANAIPFAELVRALELPTPVGSHPVFDVRFALQNHPVPELNVASLSARLRMRSSGTARFHLACEVTEDGDRMEVIWLSRASLFSEEDVLSLNSIYQGELQQACAMPGSSPTKNT